jgi:hypothetical protein
VDRVDKAKRDRETHLNIYGEALPHAQEGKTKAAGATGSQFLEPIPRPRFITPAL